MSTLMSTITYITVCGVLAVLQAGSDVFESPEKILKTAATPNIYKHICCFTELALVEYGYSGHFKTVQHKQRLSHAVLCNHVIF